MSRLSSRNRLDDFDTIAVLQAPRLVLGAANDPIVARNRYASTHRPKQLEERRDGKLVG
jgi:hypothetical protein